MHEGRVAHLVLILEVAYLQKIILDRPRRAEVDQHVAGRELEAWGCLGVAETAANGDPRLFADGLETLGRVGQGKEIERRDFVPGAVAHRVEDDADAPRERIEREPGF